jgi:hypothetical protein
MGQQNERRRRRDLELEEIPEQKASGDVAEIYRDIKDTLRAGVVNFVWRVFATKPKFLEAVWGEVKPAVDTGFMEAAEGIRAAAIERVQAATTVADHRAALGGELHQAVQELRVFLEVNPRLLILLCALKRSWEHGEVGGARDAVPTERGVPDWHPEIATTSPSGSEAREAMKELQEFLDLPSPNTDYLALAKWPDYFAEAWRGLRSFVGTDAWREACVTADWMAEQAAVALPARIGVSPDRASEFGLTDEETEEVASWIDAFHGILPGLIVNTSYLWVGLHGGTGRDQPGSFEESETER